MIRLFPADATTFTTQGLGVLEAIRCPVTEERNGVYELELQIAFVDRHYPDLSLGRLILSKPNPYEDAEPFRIYQISRPMNGIVTVNACHWSYDLSKLADKPFTASSVTEAMSKLKTQSVDTCPFNFVTDKSVTGNFTVGTPSSIRSLLGGSQGSILDVYGKGEWKFTGRTCYLYLNRGQDRGVTIRYGKNLVDLTQEENNAKVYSKLYPYWADTEGHLVTLPEDTLDINQNGNGILVYDMSDRWDTAPTETQLRTAAQSYIDANDLDKPVVNLTLSFEQISDLVKDSIYLCDTLSVEFPALGVSAKAKVIKTVYDAVLDRYEKIEVGTVKQTLAQTITELQDNSVTGAVGKSVMQSAIDSSTAQITGNKGGYIVWHDSNQDGQPDELLVMDTPSIETAVKVWRFNKNGLGFSATGYDGEYALAMTADGAIVADMITVGTLSATLMRAGILKSVNYDSSGGTAGFSMNMETGEIYAPSLVLIAKNYTDSQVSGAISTAAADATSKANAAQAAAKTYTDTQISVIPGQISSAIKEIRVGGRNILKNSETRTFTLWSGAEQDGATMTTESDVTVEEWGCNDAFRIHGKAGDSLNIFGILGNIYAPSQLSITDKDYVFSVFVKNNGSYNNMLIGFNGLGNGVTVRPKEVKRVVQVCKGNGSNNVQFVVSSPIVGNYYDLTFWHPQIEYGTTVTDWSPAPEDAVEDYNSRFNTVEQNLSSITQTTASISSEVSKKVNTTTYNANNQAVSQQISTLSSRIDQTAGSIRGIVSEEISGLADQAESISNWFDFSVSNFLTIGQAGSAYKTQITNSAFNILHGSSVIGSFSSSGLDTSAITLDTSLSLPPFTLESVNNGTEWLLTE